MESQAILDMCCGSRMFWFNKRDERAVFADIRAEEHTLCDGRRLVISPDLIADFRAFKWNETQIPVSQILALTDVKPIIGQRTGKNDKTHWIIFVKD
ncbi:TPA: hypothetical protein ACXZWJ_002568 [Salmonella enterica]